MSRVRQQPELFVSQAPRPLADRLRPTTLAETVGQDHLLGPDGPIGRMAAQGRVASMILWGPPGCGKTTIARLIADISDTEFEPLSAVFSGIADLRKIFERAKTHRTDGRGTLLFIDEIHRFNRAQQDGFLPYVEDGTVTLIGATTENPSFEINPALLSRCQVLVLHRISDDGLDELLCRAEAEEGRKLPLDSNAREALRAMADGDGRYVLNLAEELFLLPEETLLDTVALAETVQKRAPLYDKGQEAHYNLISALHKSIRGSDADAALYWLARMLEAGEDPIFIVRRMVILAAEDVGLADPQALSVAMAAQQAVHFIGLPEGYLPLAEAALYLALAPKSNSALTGYQRALADVKQHGDLAVPLHLRNAATGLMRSLGYGAGYQYAHNHEGHVAPDQTHLPEALQGQRYYEPGSLGREARLAERSGGAAGTSASRRSKRRPPDADR